MKRKSLLDRVFPIDQLELSDTQADSMICAMSQINRRTLPTDEELGLEETDG